jgi:NAD(P)-dependent dehydrogenase (short-subunit alcohol dehydrogenase family)
MHCCAALWRDAHKAGTPVSAAVVNTTAGAGLFGNPGQSNYAAAKAGVVALTLVTARELERYGVRVNAVAPVARTRLMMSTPALAEYVKAPDDPDEFDTFDPANVAPLVAYLASDECRFTGQVFNAVGGSIALYEGWSAPTQIDKQARWTAEELHAELGHLPAGPPAFAVPQPRT